MFAKKRAMLETGTKPPSFELAALDGGRESLDAILQRGPVLLAFFKSSCPVCQFTLPYLQRLSTGTGLQFAGISQDDADTTRAFNRRFGITFPTLLDEAKAGFPVSNEFGISAVPSIFLIEPNGTISHSFSGFSKADMEEVGERVGVRPFSPGENVPERKPG